MTVYLTHDHLDLPELCETQRTRLREIVGDGPFEVRAAVTAYLADGQPWRDVPRAYQALVRAGRLPDVGLIWRIARIAFREQPQANAHLRAWAETLGAENWREARVAAYAAYTYTYATYAAYAATAAALATAADAADAADDAAYAAYAAAYAAAADAADAADAHQRVRGEIIEMVIAEVERAVGTGEARL